MKPREFLDVADEWSCGNREAEWRSAASRAYFACFHTARQLLQSCGFVVPRGDQAHSYLWLRLANCGHPALQHAGNELNDMRRFRNWADYDLLRAFSAVIALDQVFYALNIINLLEMTIATPHLLPVITDAMRIYERDVLGHVTWKP